MSLVEGRNLLGKKTPWYTLLSHMASIEQEVPSSALHAAQAHSPLQCATPSNSSALACRMLPEKQCLSFRLQIPPLATGLPGIYCHWSRRMRFSALSCPNKEIKESAVHILRPRVECLRRYILCYTLRPAEKKIICFHKQKTFCLKTMPRTLISKSNYDFSRCQLSIFTRPTPNISLTCIWNQLPAPTSTIDTDDAKDLN